MYNNKIEDNLRFYNIYIRPIFDLWLIDTNLIKLIRKFESQALKMLGAISISASTDNTYKYMGITTVESRMYKFAYNLVEKGIIEECQTRTSSTKSGKIIAVGSSKTLSDKLSRFCALNPNQDESPKFNKQLFGTWRKFAHKVINNKAKYNGKRKRNNSF